MKRMVMIMVMMVAIASDPSVGHFWGQKIIFVNMLGLNPAKVISLAGLFVDAPFQGLRSL